MNESALMMTLRTVHIIAGVLWVGAVLFLTLFITPTLAASGTAGGRLLHEMGRRKLPVYMGAMPGLVLVSGLAMYWYASSRSGGAFNHSHMGMTVGLGALFALAGGIVGGAVTGRTAEALDNLGTVVRDSGNAPSAEQQGEISRLQIRLTSSGRVVSVLVLIATFLMAIARYT